MACIEEFVELLAQEEQIMTTGRFGELPALTGKKSLLLDRLAGLDRQRESTQVALGFAPGRAGAQAAAAAGDESVKQAWAALLSLAEKASERNYRNGAKVYTHLDFTQKALGFLQGSDRPFYGPDGAQTKTTGSGTRLASG